MPEALISLPDSNLAVDTRFTGSKTKKAGDSSGSTETRKEKTESFSEIKRSLERRTEKGNETDRPSKQTGEMEEVKEEKPEETSRSASEAMLSMALPYVHPETETVPSLENAVSGETKDAGAVTQANVPVAEVFAAYMAKNTVPAAESGDDVKDLQTTVTSAEKPVYEEMDNISIAARSFSESFSESASITKNNPAKTQMASPQETTAASTGENRSDPLDKLFQKNTGDPESIRETVKVREKTIENAGKDLSADTSEQVPSAKTDTLRNDFSPFKGDLPGDIFEKNILGNFKLREFLNSINGKIPLQPNGLNSIKASLAPAGNSASNLKLDAAFQDGDSSGKFILNINTNKEMLKIKTQTEGGITGSEVFRNLMEPHSGDNMKKISGPSQLNENAMTDVNSTSRQNQISSAETKDSNALPTVSKEQFTDYFISKAREFFADSVDGKRILKVIITPPDLGEVRVTMEMKKSVLHASFHCTPEAARAITSQVQNLSRSLANVGIQLGSSNIDTGQQNSNSQNYNQSQGYNHSSKSNGDAFPVQASADEDISAENSKVFNVLI